MATDSDMSASCKVVLAGTVAKSLQTEVTEGLAKLETAPSLVGFLANTDPGARMYADWTAKTCRENGVKFELREVDREDLEGHILTANHDDSIDGVIVYYPIFNDRQDQYLQQITDVSKDVEGLSHQYIFNLYQNNRFLDEEKVQKSLLPCTPLAVIKILEYLRIYNTILPYGNRLFGHSITVVNRSEVVGRPLAALLANDGACVYSVDLTGVQQFTRGEGIKKKRHEVVEKEGWGLHDCVPLSDVVISGVPGDSFKFPTEFLRDGAVCINFSTEKVRSLILDEQKLLKYASTLGHVTLGSLTVRWLSNDLLSLWPPYASSLRTIFHIQSPSGNLFCELNIGFVKLIHAV